MNVDRKNRRLIEQGRLHAVEDEWLSQVATEAGNLDYFVGVGGALVGAGEAARARTLLELLDDTLESEGRWRTRLELLRRAAQWMLDPAEVPSRILEVLRSGFPESPSFEGLAEKSGLLRGGYQEEKTWKKAELLQGLLSLDLGSIAWMKGKGAGRVVEVNLDLDSFRIDFEGHSGLLVRFKAAPSLLTPLPSGHFLRRKVEAPDELSRLGAEDPGSLLLEVLRSFSEPLTAKEIREALSGIIDAEQWTAWWAAARRHPQIVTLGKGGRHLYGWAGSRDAAQDALQQAFETADRAGRISLFRKNASRDAELKAWMASRLLQQATEETKRRPDEALAVWYLLERAEALPDPPPWTPRDLLIEADDPSQLLPAIGETSVRQSLYRLLPESREDWSEVVSKLLSREESPELLRGLVELLRSGSEKLLQAAVDQALANPRRQPALFTWLVEELLDDPLFEGRNPLRLLQDILGALRLPEFAPLRGRLAALAKAGGSLPRLIPRLNEEQASAAREALQRAPLEEFLREPLVNALEMRHPQLRGEGPAGLYALPESIAARRQELQQLLKVEIPANRKAIQEARELGDLSENFEYKSARQRQEYLSARVGKLQQELSHVVPLAIADLPTDEVRPGLSVDLEGSGSEPRTLTLLGPWESDPNQGVISYQSDLGRSLLGKKVGDALEMAGESFRIAAIRRLA